ncbi:UNVERIFIED_CONTAM: hypothetical protein K2H54_047834 [Gekko kuhli]
MMRAFLTARGGPFATPSLIHVTHSVSRNEDGWLGYGSACDETVTDRCRRVSLPAELECGAADSGETKDGLPRAEAGALASNRNEKEPREETEVYHKAVKYKSIW